MTTAPLRLPMVAAPTASLDDSAERFFAAITAAMAPEFPIAGPMATPSETALQAIALAWPHARVVSFDIFDTLLVRKVASPRDVFLHLAAPAPFSAWGLDALELARHRQEAENTARRAGLAARRSMEVTLHEIHSALAERLQRPAADVPAMVAAERLVERALCVAHPYLRTQFERAKREGKTVWCVSDTYHEAQFLRELLQSCGYDLDGVTVVSSADLRMSKGEGRLLRHVADDAHVAPAQVLHIGDHQNADFSLPAQQGFLAVLHPWAAARHEDAPSPRAGDALALGLAQIGARAVQPAFPFWWRFGYSVAGPMLTGFAEWLHAALVRDGVDRAYFLLRDGEIMRDVYDALTQGRVGPTVSLLESSRRAFVVPALDTGTSAITRQLLACEHPRPAREFLDRIGLRASEFGAAFGAVGLSPDDIVARTDAVKMQAIAALFGRKDVALAMIARARQERDLLWRYLAQEGVLAPGRIALIDIGWNGTIQKALVAAARAEKTSMDVHGYYLGTSASITDGLQGSAAHGYLFAAGQPQEHARVVQQLQQLIEFICTTARGSLTGFRKDAGRVVPVHGAVEHPEGVQRDAIAQVRQGAVAFARSVAQEQRVFGVQPISAEAALRHFARTILQPTAEDAAMIGDIRHGEGLGTTRSRALAAFRDGPFTAQSLEQDYRDAYWPVGLLARREPAALALRALRWMRSAG